MASLGNTKIYGDVVVGGNIDSGSLSVRSGSANIVEVKKDDVNVVSVDIDQCESVPIMEVRGRAPYLPNLYTGTGPALLVSSTDGQLLRDGSSERYKKNIRELTFDTSKVLDLSIKEYEYKDTGQANRSPIAEEVADIDESYVVRDSRGEPDAIYSQRIVWDLLEEVKKLRVEVEKLKEVK